MQIPRFTAEVSNCTQMQPDFARCAFARQHSWLILSFILKSGCKLHPEVL